MNLSRPTRLFQTAIVCASVASAGGAEPALSDRLLEATGAPAAAVGIWTPEGRSLSVSGHDTPGGPQITVDARWHLGSNTKSMTALLVARLAEQGVIAWEDRLGDVLPHVPDAVQAVTYAELLTHRAGLPANEPRLRSLWQVLMNSSAPIANQRAAYVQAILRQAGPPGAFLYSNAGYVTAAAMLEATTGEAWETLIAREVFEPLGLSSAGFGPPDTGPIGHSGTRCRPAERGRGADNPAYLAPAGGVHMSLSDLLTYLSVHAERPEAYLPAEAWARLHRPVGDYAMGWAVDGSSMSHMGSNTLWVAQVFVAHDPPRAMAAAINCGDGRRMVPLTQDWWDTAF